MSHPQRLDAACGCRDALVPSKPARWWHMQDGAYYCPSCMLYWWQDAAGEWHSHEYDVKAYQLAAQKAPAPVRQPVKARRRCSLEDLLAEARKDSSKKKPQKRNDASCPRRILMILQDAEKPLTAAEIAVHPLMAGVPIRTLATTLSRMKQRRELRALRKPGAATWTQEYLPVAT